MTGTLAAIGGVFAQLSLLAVGGVATVLPEMQRQVVDVHGWMTARHFASLFALGQTAPGPNMLVSTLIGWQVGGLAGALVATIGMCGPSCLLTYGVNHLWSRFRAARWRILVQAALTPVTVGLIMAGAAVLVRSTAVDWRSLGISLAVAAAVLRTRLHPLVLLAAGALLGVLGLA
jgi:chromate transporter